MEQIPQFNYTDKLDRLVATLVTQDYCVEPQFFDAELMAALYRELKERSDSQQLNEARVGKGKQLNRIIDLRGDDIHWLDGESAAQRQFISIMAIYRQQLNRHFYLGLNELEAHFSHYPVGSGYQKHLDSFRNNNLRRITIVAYLNPCWDETNGGQLQLFDNDKIIHEVFPTGGTLVSFVSEKIPHQVATTQAERFSIAGWFRVRGDSLP